MAASDPNVSTAKGRLDKGGGEPDVGYITPSDIKSAFDDLQAGWTADDAAGGGGGVTDHGALTGLSDDDHPQYLQDAPSNGSQYVRQNGAWAVVIGGGSMLGNDVAIVDPTTQYLSHTEIDDDGSNTALWPDRLSFAFEQGQGSNNFSRTGWFNEFGEIRAAAATANTVPMRVHGHTGGDSVGDIFQVSTETGGTVLLSVNMDGATLANTQGQALRLDRTGVSADDIFQIRTNGTKRTYAATGGALRVGCEDAAVETFRVIPPASMTANIMRVQDGTGADALRVDSSGRVRIEQEPTQATQAATKQYVDTADAGKVANVQGVAGIWTGTQAAYDLLTPDASTLYVIVG